jgi:hypothetical protein
MSYLVMTYINLSCLIVSAMSPLAFVARGCLFVPHGVVIIIIIIIIIIYL